jgi:hypothetical protein
MNKLIQSVQNVFFICNNLHLVYLPQLIFVKKFVKWCGINKRNNVLVLRPSLTSKEDILNDFCIPSFPTFVFQYFEVENGKIMPKKKDFSQNCFERRYLFKTFPRKFL